MTIRTRVRFADGTEEVLDSWRQPDLWPDGTPRISIVLTIAVELAEWDHRQAHAGAWLEFAPVVSQ